MSRCTDNPFSHYSPGMPSPDPIAASNSLICYFLTGPVSDDVGKYQTMTIRDASGQACVTYPKRRLWSPGSCKPAPNNGLPPSSYRWPSHPSGDRQHKQVKLGNEGTLSASGIVCRLRRFSQSSAFRI